MLIQELLKLNEAQTEKVRCFKISWPEGYGKQKPKKVGMDWFSDDMGFKKSDIEEIADLGVGQEWTSGGPVDRVEVQRLKDCAPDKLQESQISEGVYVVKNKSGDEKRFKDANSDEAKAWKSSESKSKNLEKYTQEWWKVKERRDYDAIVPWSPITESDVYPQLKKFVKDTWGATQYDLSSMMGATSEKLVDGVKCTTRYIRVMVMHEVDHDAGLENDVEESYRIQVWRDPKNPKKLNFSF